MTLHAVILPRIVFHNSNKRILFGEGGVNTQITLRDPATGLAIPDGTSVGMYLRGDGATDDLCRALEETFEAHAGTNTYAVSVSYSADPANPCGTLTVARSTGASTFQILWADAQTTFDEGLVGFTNANTANDSANKVSTLSPSACWVSPEPYTSKEPADEFAASVVRARSGKIFTVRNSSVWESRVLAHQLVDSRRVKLEDIAADPNRSLQAFMRNHGGARVEVHHGTPASMIIPSLSSSTRIGTAWHFSEETQTNFSPKRINPGLALYGFELELLGYVA